MIRGCASALALVLLPTVCLAQDDLVPLNKVSQETKQDALYILQRCAAVSIVMSGVVGTSESEAGKARAKEMSDLLQKRSEQFAKGAIVFQSSIYKEQGRTFGDDATDEIGTAITGIAGYYRSDLDRHYQLTGQTISDLVLIDTKACTEVANQGWMKP